MIRIAKKLRKTLKRTKPCKKASAAVKAGIFLANAAVLFNASLSDDALRGVGKAAEVVAAVAPAAGAAMQKAAQTVEALPQQLAIEKRLPDVELLQAVKSLRDQASVEWKRLREAVGDWQPAERLEALKRRIKAWLPEKTTPGKAKQKP